MSYSGHSGVPTLGSIIPSSILASLLLSRATIWRSSVSVRSLKGRASACFVAVSLFLVGLVAGLYSYCYPFGPFGCITIISIIKGLIYFGVSGHYAAFVVAIGPVVL